MNGGLGDHRAAPLTTAFGAKQSKWSTKAPVDSQPLTIDGLLQWPATEKHRAAPLKRPKMAELLGRGILIEAPAYPATLSPFRHLALEAFRTLTVARGASWPFIGLNGGHQKTHMHLHYQAFQCASIADPAGGIDICMRRCGTGG